jgi:hypothetical protein
MGKVTVLYISVSMFYLTGQETKDSGTTRCLTRKDYKLIVVAVCFLSNFCFLSTCLYIRVIPTYLNLPMYLTVHQHVCLSLCSSIHLLSFLTSFLTLFLFFFLQRKQNMCNFFTLTYKSIQSDLSISMKTAQTENTRYASD